MAVSIEDILLLRAQQDLDDQITTESASVIGAGIGSTAGVTVGALANRLRPQTQISTLPPTGVGYRLTPGKRMAGGLVGLVLGGGLGAGSAQMMQQNSPAAELLAKLQTQGTLSPGDTNALQTILADTYSSTLGM